MRRDIQGLVEIQGEIQGGLAAAGMIGGCPSIRYASFRKGFARRSADLTDLWVHLSLEAQVELSTPV